MTDFVAVRSPLRVTRHGRVGRGAGPKLRLIDWIWHVRGTVALTHAWGAEEVFDRLDPLFRQTGTRHARSADTLTFEKTDPAAQDKMSIFDRGTLRIDAGADGAVLRYDLVSRALLLCCLAPVLFLGIAQVTKVLIVHERARSDAVSKAEKAKHTSRKPHKVQLLNPVDKFLGAPAPDDPKKKKKDETDKKDKLSATPAYIFAGIFAVLYLVGRVLEDRLIRSLFRKRLASA